MKHPSRLLRAWPLVSLLASALIDSSQMAAGRPGTSSSIVDRLGNRRRSIASRDVGRSARIRSTTGTVSTVDSVIDSGVVTSTSATPSNGDLLLQYLNKKASTNGKTAQQLIEKLISKKGGIEEPQVASTAALLVEPEVEESGDLVEVVNTQACDDTPVSQAYDCVQKEFKQTAYSCSIDFYPEVCTIVIKPMQTSCPKDVERTITYQCPKLKNKQMCYNIPKAVQTVCTGTANQAKETDCQRVRTEKVCSIVEETIPWTCLETKPLTLDYTCSKVEPTTDCSPNVVAVDDDCTRETNVPVVYDYYDVEPQTECHTERKKNMCQKNVRSVNLYSCPETYYEQECTMVTVPVTKMCDTPATVTEEYPCEKTETRVFKKACGFGQGKKFLRISDTVTDNGTDNGKSLCDYEAPVTVSTTCTREATVVKQEPCTETEQQEQCEMVEKTREKSCETPTVRSVETECDDWVEEEVCEEVNKTVTKKGVRFETKTESFPCTSTYAKEVCVEVQSLVDSTCSAQLRETQEVSCTRSYKRQVCENNNVSSIELCADVSEEAIEYDCQQITYEEKCSTVPYYELEDCEVTLVETELTPCEGDYQVTECTPQESPQMGTCFNDEEVDVASTCYRIESQNTCQDVITTRVIKDTVNYAASTVSASPTESTKSSIEPTK
ncbi:hypothetical protein cyc_01027 [Cyclospora cayetanensis]|uniref:Toxoplasma gondii family D protein n=1 Tax=Cyclospora cayetanensis TaxID=88456 RepID=A0A1D3CWH3_9EIME|nr:hypothetical protein cyc_01027 [Cyclospora cayetanensis]